MRSVWLLLVVVIAGISQPASAMDYSTGHNGGNCSTCAWIAADGTIEANELSKLKAFIRANNISYQTNLLINSPGGSLAAAIELGEYVRSRGMDVMVGTSFADYEFTDGQYQTKASGTCASACVFVLMAGRSRTLIGESSRVGVHQFYPATDAQESVATTTSATQSLMASLFSYALRMGVDPDVLAVASTASPDQMIWLELRDMERLKLLTSRSYLVPADWTLKPAGPQLIASVIQEQYTGRRTLISVACSAAQFGFEVMPGKQIGGVDVDPAQRISAIASTIDGIRLKVEDAAWSAPLAIRSISQENGFIFITTDSGPLLIDSISQAADKLLIEVDLPRVYVDEFGGWTYSVPTSNFSTMAPHLRRTC